MILYEVNPSQERKEVVLVEATHKWSLPGVKCNLCGAMWGSSGIAYPLVDLSGLSYEKRIRSLKSWPVSLDELEKMRRPIANLLSHNLPLPPGTQFGPLIGSAEGPFSDFVWNGYFDILVKAEALDRIRLGGARLSPGVHPMLTFRGGYKSDLLELQIEPRSKMILPSDSPPICPACGRWGIKRPDEVVIDISSLPDDVDLFRVIDFGTIILATERFAEITQNLKLSGISFEKVKCQ